MTSNSLSFTTVSGGNSLNPKYAKFSWSATWDNTNRRWNIGWNVTAQGGYNSTAYVQTQNGTVTIGAGDGTLSGGGTKTMSGPIAQTHNNDIMLEGSFTLTPTNTGAASFTVSGSVQFWLVSSFGTSTLAETAQTLDTVSTASTVSLNVATKTIAATSDSNITVTVRSTGNYYHVLRYKTDNSSAYVNIWTAENVNNTSKTATISPTNILAKFPSKESGTLTVECLTYTTSAKTVQVGTTQTATCAITITKANFKPTVSLSAVAVNSYSSAGEGTITNALVAGYSTAKSTPTVSAGTGTSISSITYTISPGSFAKQTGTATSGTAITSSTLPSSASNYTVTFAVTATDARGATTSASVSGTVYGYSAPKITTNIYRVASSGATTRDDAGTYVRIAFSATLGASVNSKNALATPECTASGTITGAQTTGTWRALATDKTATFTITAKDKVTTVTTTVQISAAKFALELYDDKAGNLWVQSGGYFRSLKAGSNDTAGFQVRSGTANVSCGFSVKRTDNNRDIQLLISSNGVARGLYSTYLGDWIIYYNDTSIVLNKPVAAFTMNGALTSSANITTSADVYARTFYSTNTTSNGSVGCQMRFSDAATANGVYSLIYSSYVNTSGRIIFRQYSGSSSGRTSYYDQFYLPATSASKDANNSYNILTTKNLVTVAQGGTGVNSAKGSAKQPVYLSSSGIAACTGFGRLLNSEFKAGSTAVTFTGAASNYNYLILVGQPSTSQTTAYTSIYVPIPSLSTSNQLFSFANETAGASVYLKLSGTGNADITMTWYASTYSNGRITSVYGGI